MAVLAVRRVIHRDNPNCERFARNDSSGKAEQAFVDLAPVGARTQVLLGL
ncbi:helix-turn-helix domain-containing protein [Mesorhizobium qingshengii]